MSIMPRAMMNAFLNGHVTYKIVELPEIRTLALECNRSKAREDRIWSRSEHSRMCRAHVMAGMLSATDSSLGWLEMLRDMARADCRYQHYMLRGFLWIQRRRQVLDKKIVKLPNAPSTHVRQ